MLCLEQWKKNIALILSVSLLCYLFAIPSVFADTPSTANEKLNNTNNEIITEKRKSLTAMKSKAAVLMEFSRGEIIYQENGSKPLPPASLTKIMTLLLTLEALKEGKVSWQDEVKISKEAWETQGSTMFLEVDQYIPLGDLILGIAIVSANDACVAVAEHLYGSESSFVHKMNEKASEIGLNNTVFQNSNGLPHPQHLSSAKDMAKLSHYFITRFPHALNLLSQEEFVYNDISQSNRNNLLEHYEGADGLKTGYTREAGFCLVGTASRGEIRFINVVLGAENSDDRFKDSKKMLDYAFSAYTLEKMYSAGDLLEEIKVTSGKEPLVKAKLEKDIEIILPFHKKEELEINIDAIEKIPAPVEKGAKLGNVQVVLGDKIIEQAPLFAAQEREKAHWFTLAYMNIQESLNRFRSKLKGILPDNLVGLLFIANHFFYPSISSFSTA